MVPILGAVLALTSSLPQAQAFLRSDSCPPAALALANTVMVAETIGVGLSSVSRDSSRIDTLATERLEGGLDISYVMLNYQLTCLFATADSVILRLTSTTAG